MEGSNGIPVYFMLKGEEEWRLYINTYPNPRRMFHKENEGETNTT